jgi:hypothetical protein
LAKVGQGAEAEIEYSAGISTGLKQQPQTDSRFQGIAVSVFHLIYHTLQMALNDRSFIWIIFEPLLQLAETGDLAGSQIAESRDVDKSALLLRPWLQQSRHNVRRRNVAHVLLHQQDGMPRV